MVTKHNSGLLLIVSGSVLAKIHMVTKLDMIAVYTFPSSVLAKIHMVTKHIGNI